MNRFYRDQHKNEGQLRFEVIIDESDLLIIMSPCDKLSTLKQIIEKKVIEIRDTLKAHMHLCPEFLTSLKSMALSHLENANKTKSLSDEMYDMLHSMYEASSKASVGPMATVAGMTSEVVGKHIMKLYGDIDIMIENGGDLFLNVTKERHIAIYAGESPLSNKLQLKVLPEQTPLGICTSAGSVGHSLSFGHADACVVVSKSTALADAMATSMGNKVITYRDITDTLNYGYKVDGIIGAIVIIEDKMGAIGDIELC